MNAHIDMAWQCIEAARRAINAEFELDAATNLYRKPLPDWAATVRDQLHAAKDNLLNAIEEDES